MTEENINDLILQRRKKLEEIRALGVDPYGGRFEITHAAGDLLRAYGSHPAEALDAQSLPCALAGRIMALRSFGKAAFAHLQDGTDRIQLHFRRDLLGEGPFALFRKLDLGDYLGVEGRLFRTKTGELTVEVKAFTLLAKALRPLPEKWHGLSDVEIRYRQRYLDLLVNPRVREIFLLRSRIIQAIRRFLNARAFLEVETPMMQPIPGGAAARPFVTHHNALDIDLYLRIAPELYLKRLVVGGFERVYEINRNFRNEGISTQHNPEFTMLEFYMAHADYRDLMPLTEELITTVAREVFGTLQIPCGERVLDLTPPWRRMTIIEALQEYGGIDPALLRDEVRLRQCAREREIPAGEAVKAGKIVQRLFEDLVEEHLFQPTFILDYPTDVSPLAKRKAEDPALTERFELYLGGREVANAFSELNDPLDQRQRFEQQAIERAGGDLEAQPLDEDFLRALEHGMPPTAGEGIGIDRLVMVLTDTPSIREVILFPQMRPESPPPQEPGE
ncbi:MAG: lysine--tRNA ligase [Nitrospirae bacterium]|nr:lysine--tRNA ligase [Nitrospirota bacterium]